MTDLSALLPQLQCQRCGFVSCDAYADAMRLDKTPGDRCAPGGSRVLHELNRALGQQNREVDPSYFHETIARGVAIDENSCIGCALCIKACPVDAIVGSGKVMHSVILEACTGCELCRPVCPVDCITPTSVFEFDSLDELEEIATRKPAFRKQWLRQQTRLQGRQTPVVVPVDDRSERQRQIEASVGRVRARRRTDSL